MILRKFIKKALGLVEPGKGLSWMETTEHRLEITRRDKEISDVKGQLKVDEAEITNLKCKLFKIREILGEDDLTFSKFTRSQIAEMSIEDFNSVESEIDKDVCEGKIFLQ